MECKICGDNKFIARGKDRCLSCFTSGLENGHLIIGIDPDCELNGYAEWDIKQKRLTVSKQSFFQIFDILHSSKNDIALVRIEAGWHNKKSNFHSNSSQSKSVGENIAKKVGSNHETGRKLVEMCQYLDIQVEEVKPLGTKSVDAKLFKKMTGIAIRTNQDMRDAGMLVFKYK
mgnify:CR=1 FL=1